MEIQRRKRGDEMLLKIIGSGSSGNGYILESENEALLLEVGVKVKDMKRSIGWNISKICGCLISHEHG